MEKIAPHVETPDSISTHLADMAQLHPEGPNCRVTPCVVGCLTQSWRVACNRHRPAGSFREDGDHDSSVTSVVLL